jgi:hypothetical protein
MANGTTRARAGNLTAALVAIAFLELLLNRLAGRLFLPRSPITGEAGAGSALVRVLADSGPFLFHLTGVLGLGMLLAAFAGLLRRNEFFPRAIRLSLVVIGLFFWVFGVLAVVFGHLPPRFFVFLEISFAFLSLLIAASLLGSAARRRIKLGVVLFAAPGVLHVLSIMVDRLGWLSGAVAPLEVTRAGEMTLLCACLAAPLLLPPRPVRERAWLVPLSAALALTVLFGVGLATRYDLVQATALYALRLEMPRLDSVLGAVYVLAFFGWTYATVQLLLDRGGMRLAGYGLLLLAAGGYQASSPVELALSLLGLLALSVGELRAVPYGEQAQPRIASAEWRGFVGRVATAAGDGTGPEDAPPDAVVVEDGEAEVSRIRAHRRSRPVMMRFRRRRGAVVELEIVVGQPGHGDPDASIERHRRWMGRSLSERVPHPRTKTGDPTFDQRFTVSGNAPLADAELRRRLARQQGDGTVSLWRGAAARYVISDPDPLEAPPPFAGQVAGEVPVAAVVAILDTLVDLVEASALPAPS